MTFRTFIGVCILGLIVGALSLHKPTPIPNSPAAAATTRQAKKLSPVEECANMQLIIDRSIGVLKAFEICKDPKHAFENWIAYNQSKIPVVRVVPY